MRVTNTVYSAQYGHTTGGTIEYRSKSGTNEWHGSFYEYFANDALNARGFFETEVSKQRSNQFGFTVGGPIMVPGLYEGRNRTFFFFNMDWLRFRSGALPGFGNTTPIDAFKRGDFAALLGSRQIGTDVLGRPIMEGQIFDPATTRTLDGVLVRDPFPNNFIPISHPERSHVAATILPLMDAPDRGGLAFNVVGGAVSQTWKSDFQMTLFRLDHHFDPRFRTTSTFFWPQRPRTYLCGGVGGCSAPFDSESESAKNNEYFGAGNFQRIATHHIHQQFDWIMSSTLLNHTTVAFDRWFMGNKSLSAGVGWPDRLWGRGQSGLVDLAAGPPQLRFTGNIPYTPLGSGRRSGFEASNRWQFANDLTWVRGKHTFKFGYEFRHHQFNFHGWAANTGGLFEFNRLGTAGYDAKGNSISATGDPFSSFLLGQVHRSEFVIPALTTFNGNWISAFINDDVKVTNNLTLTLGVRFDYQSDMTFTVRLKSASPVAASALGSPIKTFLAKFQLEQTDPRLLPDLSAVVVIPVDDP